MLMEGRFATIKRLIAESMNDFFCNIGKNPLLESRFSVNEHNLRFEFQAVNIAQVEKVFGKFKESLGFGTDGMPIIS